MNFREKLCASSGAAISSARVKSIRGAVGTMLLLAGVCASIPAAALPIEATVGTGSSTANILIEFQDGAAFLFEVLFDGASITGIDAMNTLDAGLANLSLVLLDFGAFGFAVDGITYDAHSDLGFGGGELYWHYWTKEAELDPWLFSSVGASFRNISDGGWDGWRYGANAPVPEPGTAVLVGIGLAGLSWSRRQSRSVA